MSRDNPFERFDVDPRSSPKEITARFRELAEDAKSDEERAALRAAWEELTLHPRERLRAALSTFPEAREEIPLGVDAKLPLPPALTPLDVGLLDLLAPLTVESAIPPDLAPEAAPETLANDPLLAPWLSNERTGRAPSRR